jgi:hypothetical protein
MLFGISNDVAVFSMGIIFYAILIFSVYGIGKALAGDMAGLLAAFIVTMYPFSYSLSRHYFLDFPLMAMVSSSIYFSLIIRKSRKWHNFALLIISLTGVFLIKRIAIFFIAPFIPYSFIFARDKKVIFTLALSAALLLPWYGLSFLPNIKRYLSSIFWMGAFQPGGGGQWFTIHGFLYYVRVIILEQTSIVYFILLFIAVIICARNKFGYIRLMALGVAIPYLCLTFISMKNSRYIMPCLPILALISATGISLIKNGGIKKYAVIFVIFYSVAQFSFQSIGLAGFIESHISSGRGLRDGIKKYLKGIPYEYKAFPQRGDWRIEEVLRVIKKEAGFYYSLKNRIGIAFIGNHPFYNKYTLSYYILLNGYDNFNIIEASWSRDPELELSNPDTVFIIYKNNDSRPDTLEELNTLLCRKWIEKNIKSLAVVYSGELPDITSVQIYRKI